MSLDQQLETRLAALRDQGLLRELRRVDSAQGTRIQIAGQTLLNFSSNDYLGLANNPRLKQAAVEALERFGVGAGASRLICGSLSPHHELEEALANFKGTEAALTFSSGYATAVGTLCALMGKDDVVILDKLVHACVVDAAKLSGAKLRVFAHNDPNDLEQILKWAGSRTVSTPGATRHTLIVTESVFSMDGDCAPLRELVALKDRYGAWLMVDEAHATGLYGERGQGLAGELGVADRIEIQMGTLGKALGASGGYIAGSRKLVDYLVNRARSFVFSTAPSPAVAAAAAEAVLLIQRSEGEALRQKLWQRVAEFSSASPKPQAPSLTAIIPHIVGEERKAVQSSAALRARGFFVPAIRYPTVARGAARLRITLTAAHTAEDVAALLRALADLKSEISDLESP
ncbi:MAG TPA: 8-amino-7-oxononanoate synthase [Verrucomicrobiae bacterium]